jgi:hypothetical protein
MRESGNVHHNITLATLRPAMAANEAPDPRSFKTWEDAFQFPVPVIRKLEQQLRANANENREQLRTLVGYVNSNIKSCI